MGIRAFSSALAVCVTVLCVAAAGAGAAEVVLKKGHRGPPVAKVQRKLGVRPADGDFGPITERAVKRFQRRRGLAVDGIVGPATRRALGLASFSRRGLRSYRPTMPAVLERIAQCESKGDPTAVSGRGRYRGKYQFSRATWRSIGGKGDPAKASEGVQDRMARKLLRTQGPGAWPNCA